MQIQEHLYRMCVPALDLTGKGEKKQLLLWDGTRRAILSIPLSNHQSLKESAHVISPSCNLLGLQLKACVDGLHLSASP